MLLSFTLSLLQLTTLGFGLKGDPVTIKAKVPSQFNNQYAYIKVLEAQKQLFVKTDSVLIKNNAFELQTKIDQLTLGELTIGSYQQFIALEKGVIKAHIDPTTQTISLQGTPNNDKLTAFTNQLTILVQQANDFQQEVSATLEQAIEQNNGKVIDSLSLAFQPYLTKVTQHIEQQSTKDPNSFTSALFLYQTVQSDYVNLHQAQIDYTMLSQELKKSNLGQAIKFKLEELTAYNSQIYGIAPNIVTTDTQGNSFELYDNLRPITLVHFWAPWCGACSQTAHHLVDTYKAFGDDELRIISIAVDCSEQEMISAAKEHGFTWPTLLSTSEIESNYNITQIPTVYYLNNKAEIIYSDTLEQTPMQVIHTHYHTSPTP